MRQHQAPSKCAVFRPDAGGALVQVAVMSASKPTAPVRPGAVFGAWDDEVQSWHDDQPVTLDSAAETACRFSLDVCFYGGEYCPKPLNASEKSAVRRLMREGSE